MSEGCIHSDEVNCGHPRGSLSRTCAEVGGVLSSARMCKSQKEKKRVRGFVADAMTTRGDLQEMRMI
jgi:hypothetical protein